MIIMNLIKLKKHFSREGIMEKKLKKVVDKTFKKGAIPDDSIYLHLIGSFLNPISRKPTEEDSEMTVDTGDLSSDTIYTKNFRIAIWIEEN